MSDDILDILRNHFQSTDKKCEKRICIDAPREQVYYLLVVRNAAYHLEFWIDTCALHRDALQRTLHELFSSQEAQRNYSLLAYYSARGVQGRRPVLTVEQLENDYADLKKRLAVIENSVRLASNPDSTDPPVGIRAIDVLSLLAMSLNIPDYQRAYCWEDANILGLLEDLSQWSQRHVNGGSPYRLGTIILKEQRDGSFDVIDGQQRLITLALIASRTNPAIKFHIMLGSNNRTKKALDAILKARTVVEEWFKKHQAPSEGSTQAKPLVDLEMATVGLVVIGEKMPEDLSFTFFNHLNSSGVLLTDYELLKGHHLRFVKESGTAEIMARRWHELEKGKNEGEQRQLLHLCLFRIRKWLSGERFRADADRLETHELFKEFSLQFERLEDLCTSYKPIAIDSLLSGGIEFFEFVERFRRQFESFLQQPAVAEIEPLRWHSNGTLYEGILALAFMFFCKFGDIYLNEAVYAIAWAVSRLRNGGQVRRDIIGQGDEFRLVAQTIARATHESEVLGRLLDRLQVYSIENRGRRASNYWQALGKVAKNLLNSESCLIKNHLDFIQSLTNDNNSTEKA